MRSSENMHRNLWPGQQYILQSKYCLARSLPTVKSLKKAETTACTTSMEEKDFIKPEVKRADLVFSRETHLLDGEK